MINIKSFEEALRMSKKDTIEFKKIGTAIFSYSLFLMISIFAMFSNNGFIMFYGVTSSFVFLYGSINIEKITDEHDGSYYFSSRIFESFIGLLSPLAVGIVTLLTIKISNGNITSNKTEAILKSFLETHSVWISSLLLFIAFFIIGRFVFNNYKVMKYKGADVNSSIIYNFRDEIEGISDLYLFEYYNALANEKHFNLANEEINSIKNKRLQRMGFKSTSDYLLYNIQNNKNDIQIENVIEIENS